LTRDRDWPAQFAHDVSWLAEPTTDRPSRPSAVRHLVTAVLLAALAASGWLWLRDRRRALDSNEMG
jgi:hypothetical protein